MVRGKKKQQNQQKKPLLKLVFTLFFLSNLISRFFFLCRFCICGGHLCSFTAINVRSQNTIWQCTNDWKRHTWIHCSIFSLSFYPFVPFESHHFLVTSLASYCLILVVCPGIFFGKYCFCFCLVLGLQSDAHYTAYPVYHEILTDPLTIDHIESNFKYQISSSFQITYLLMYNTHPSVTHTRNIGLRKFRKKTFVYNSL